MNKEELIKQLKRTNKMSNKHLAKRIELVLDNDREEQERINEKCYLLLIKLLDNKSKTTVVTLDAIAKLLAQRIYNDSLWQVTPNYDFYKYDHITGGTYVVINNNDNYEPFNKENPKKEIEEDFIIEYQPVLDMIIRNIEEKTMFLTTEYQTEKEEDRILAENLITYLNLNNREKTKVKIK